VHYLKDVLHPMYGVVVQAILLLLISNNKMRLTHFLDVTINANWNFFDVVKAKFCNQMYP
jgi:hypothetical protein